MLHEFGLGSRPALDEVYRMAALGKRRVAARRGRKGKLAAIWTALHPAVNFLEQSDIGGVRPIRRVVDFAMVAGSLKRDGYEQPEHRRSAVGHARTVREWIVRRVPVVPFWRSSCRRVDEVSRRLRTSVQCVTYCLIVKLSVRGPTAPVARQSLRPSE